MLGKSSNREGKAGGKLPMEERGDAKLHLLSPRRHLPHVTGRGFPRGKEEAAVRTGGGGGGDDVFPGEEALAVCNNPGI
jgi:hypothetical protein